MSEPDSADPEDPTSPEAIVHRNLGPDNHAFDFWWTLASFLDPGTRDDEKGLLAVWLGLVQDESKYVAALHRPLVLAKMRERGIDLEALGRDAEGRGLAEVLGSMCMIVTILSQAGAIHTTRLPDGEVAFVEAYAREAEGKMYAEMRQEATSARGAEPAKGVPRGDDHDIKRAKIDDLLRMRMPVSDIVRTLNVNRSYVYRRRNVLREQGRL